MNTMKKILLFHLSMLLCGACQPDDEAAINRHGSVPEGVEPRQAMRDFVVGISEYAKAAQPEFLIIPQNGIELVTTNGEEDGEPHAAYLAATDGHGQEDLFYGYENDDQRTGEEDNQYLRGLLDVAKEAGNVVLVTDYCSSPAHMDDAYRRNQESGYVSLSADHRELDHIPTYPSTIHQENEAAVTSLTQVQNFLYLINPVAYHTKDAFISAVTATNYDLLIMDLFFHDDTPFTAEEVEQLRRKANGGQRLVISYMSIGEAEDYRYYWQATWNNDPPAWLDGENPNWEGNFKVKYWEAAWQNMMYGNEEAYLQKILDAGFDGVYLDIIDAFEYYE